MIFLLTFPSRRSKSKHGLTNLITSSHERGQGCAHLRLQPRLLLAEVRVAAATAAPVLVLAGEQQPRSCCARAAPSTPSDLGLGRAPHQPHGEAPHGEADASRLGSPGGSDPQTSRSGLGYTSPIDEGGHLPTWSTLAVDCAPTTSRLDLSRRKTGTCPGGKDVSRRKRDTDGVTSFSCFRASVRGRAAELPERVQGQDGYAYRQLRSVSSHPQRCQRRPNGGCVLCLPPVCRSATVGNLKLRRSAVTQSLPHARPRQAGRIYVFLRYHDPPRCDTDSREGVARPWTSVDATRSDALVSGHDASCIHRDANGRQSSPCKG